MWLLELLLPARCVSCRSPGGSLCDPCAARLQPVRPPLCDRCGAPTAWPVGRCRECAGRRLGFASARAAVLYAGPTPALVHAWKERGLRPLARTAAGLVEAHVTRPPAADVITYIPPDRDRTLRRGGHAAEALARELGRRWELEVAGVLARRRPAPRQTGLPRDERRRNVRGAFAAPARIRAATVVLVDDVYTTGATAAAASAVLRAAGARVVHVVTFARTVR